MRSLLNNEEFEEGPIYSLSVTHSGQQTDMNGTAIDHLLIENRFFKSRLFDVNIIEGDDKKTSFYTGLQSWAVFIHVYMFLSPHLVSQSSLSEFFLVLVRLRLGLLQGDLADRFQISIPAVSHVFQKWLRVMYSHLNFLIKWPSREVVRNNLPLSFKELYPNCVCIIDCSEIFIQTPLSFQARSKMYSNYKKHKTIKFCSIISKGC